jgi:hypothetical protein
LETDQQPDLSFVAKLGGKANSRLHARMCYEPDDEDVVVAHVGSGRRFYAVKVSEERRFLRFSDCTALA